MCEKSEIGTGTEISVESINDFLYRHGIMELGQSELEFILNNKLEFNFDENIIHTIEGILKDRDGHRERCEFQKTASHAQLMLLIEDSYKKDSE